MAEVTLLAAFVAGVLSISSPCCLPLIPIFLAHVTGSSIGEAGAPARVTLMRHAVAYVLGFSLVFIALGAALGATGALAASLDVVAHNRAWLVRVGGALLLILGVHQLGWIRLPALARTRRAQLATSTRGSLPSSFLIGISFGAGWSPCVGPILGAILTMAAGQGSVEQATSLLAVYSLGMAVPFLGLAFTVGAAPRVIRSLQRRMAMVTTVSGAVMLGIGAIMVLGIFEQVFVEIVRVAPWLPY